MTSTDVARRAGVSRATVSYVLNDAPKQTISKQTREVVLRAARDLGYTPHPGARSLRSGRSDIVLLPLPGLTLGHVAAELIDVCAAALHEHRLTLVTDVTSHDSPEARAESWLRLGPAAVVDFVLHRDDPTAEVLRRAGVIVLTPAIEAADVRHRPIDAISDHAREVQVRHLLDAGHRDLAWVLPADVIASETGRGRQRGMKAAVRQAGGRLRTHGVELERESLLEVAREWGDPAQRPDAVCALNDELAIGLVDALAMVGVRVPQDIAVIGVDDIPLASVVSPSVTSVAWNVEALGQTIAAATVALINGEPTPETFPLPKLAVVARETA